MKTITFLALAFLVACSSSSTNKDAGSSNDAGNNNDAGPNSNPAPPALKTTEVDRMGRPAINTALTDPFDSSMSNEGSEKDAYNAAADRSQWVTMFSPQFQTNLAIYDSLDGVCGNQFAAGPTATAGRYNTLATVLADDVLLVNTGSGTCTTYLGVEANATGAIPNSDCGGRTPLENTIDETYSLFAIGMPTGVTNGVTVKAGTQASLSTFPFLASPN